MTILLAEDDAHLARLIQRGLLEEGYAVDVTGDGLSAYERALAREYDAILLDVMLPRLDGFEVTLRLREQNVHTAILLVTARDAVTYRVHGLDVGADDYLVKPFAMEELFARVRALMRRAAPQAGQTVLQLDDLTADLARREVVRGGHSIDLTVREFDLLVFLLRHPGQVLSRSQLYAHVWGSEADATSNVVDLYIHYLRQKIDSDSSAPLLRTVRGIGYMIKA